MEFPIFEQIQYSFGKRNESIMIKNIFLNKILHFFDSVGNIWVWIWLDIRNQIICHSISWSLNLAKILRSQQILGFLSIRCRIIAWHRKKCAIKLLSSWALIAGTSEYSQRRILFFSLLGAPDIWMFNSIDDLAIPLLNKWFWIFAIGWNIRILRLFIFDFLIYIACLLHFFGPADSWRISALCEIFESGDWCIILVLGVKLYYILWVFI